MRKQLNITAYQVRVSADGFKTFITKYVTEYQAAKRIAERCRKLHKTEARVLTVHSR